MTHYEHHFDSWYDFVTDVADDSRHTWGNYHFSHSRGNADWAGTETFQQAIDMAIRIGWPEGRKLLTDSLAIARPKPEPFRSLEFSVAGAFPSVPMYCAGDPECMVIDPGSDIRHSKPIIKIDYSAAGISMIPAKALMTRGAAVVSFAETLERQGYSTQIRVVMYTEFNAGSTLVKITFKRAGEPLDIDRAAFALANPALHRRLHFALFEQHKDLRQASYGRTLSSPPAKMLDPDAVFVPGPAYNETPETARKAVELAAQGLISEISENAEGDD